jgi:hypothetical protein
MFSELGVTWGSFILLYLIGMLWTVLSWVRTIHESHAAANLSSVRRSEKNRENALRQSARDTFREGIWCIPFWPILVIRNLRSVIVVAKDYRVRSKNESQRH